MKPLPASRPIAITLRLLRPNGSSHIQAYTSRDGLPCAATIVGLARAGADAPAGAMLLLSATDVPVMNRKQAEFKSIAEIAFDVLPTADYLRLMREIPCRAGILLDAKIESESGLPSVRTILVVVLRPLEEP